MPATRRFTLVLACVVWGSTLASTSQNKPAPSDLNRLVAEGGTGSRMGDGVLHIRKGSGWVRTRRIFADFSLSVEVRLISAKSELSIGVRTVNVVDEWPRRGYRFLISSTKPATLIASGYGLKQQEGGSATPTTIGDWHVVRLVGKGPQLEAWIDGARAGTYAMDVLAGSLLFQAAGDDAEVRNITFDAPMPSAEIRFKEYHQRPEFTEPRLVREVKPNYSRNAMAEKVQGVVCFEAAILPDGSVGGVGLTQLLHPELEHSALAAVRRWRFSPGLLNGKPVSVLIEVEMSFTLK